MDRNDPSRRAYDPYPAQQQQSQQPIDEPPAQHADPESHDRSRQNPYLQNTASPQTSRDMQQMYSFTTPSAQYGAIPSMQTGLLQYPTQTVQPPESPRQHQQQQQQQSQQYQPYGPGLLYGMAQPSTQQNAASAYNSVSQYRSRASAGSTDALGAQYGGSQSAQYYLPSQPGSTPVPAPVYSQYPSAGYAQPGPSTPQQTYLGTMGGTTPTGTFPSYSQQSQYTTQQMLPQNATDQAFSDYQARVRLIFTLAHDGTLRDMPDQLVHISRYLLGNVEALGLTRDEESLRDDRIRLWDRFNTAWLVALQRQFDLTEDALRMHRPLGEPQSLMPLQALENLCRELVRLCDNVERFGLVDYQMGVAEEQIMDLLLRCISLLDPSSAHPEEELQGEPLTITDP